MGCPKHSHFDVLKKQGGIYVLVSKSSGRVLKKFGKSKPTPEEIAKEERRIAFFKNDVRKKVPKKPRVSSLQAPMAIERQYQTQIRKTLSLAADQIRMLIIPALPQLVADNKLFRGDSIRLDQGQPVGDVISELYQSVNVGLDGVITNLERERLAQAIALETNGWNKQQIHRVFRQALGVNLLQGEPWLAEMLQIFALNNANLISNVSTTFISQTQQIVNEGMIKGWRHEVIAKKLLGTGKDELDKVSRFTMAKTRADLIGRDQVNKLNGQLSHLRQINTGIVAYFWRDSNDTRVRPSHSGFNGTRFLWSRGAAGGIHPGDEIQCRCWPEPDFSTIKL